MPISSAACLLGATATTFRGELHSVKTLLYLLEPMAGLSLELGCCIHNFTIYILLDGQMCNMN